MKNWIHRQLNPGYGEMRIFSFLFLLFVIHLFGNSIHRFQSDNAFVSKLVGWLPAALTLIVGIAHFYRFFHELFVATKVIKTGALPCTKCGYPLDKDETTPCPECGTLLSQKAVKEYWTKRNLLNK